jgi:hypothetical protein
MDQASEHTTETHEETSEHDQLAIEVLSSAASARACSNDPWWPTCYPC